MEGEFSSGSEFRLEISFCPREDLARGEMSPRGEGERRRPHPRLPCASSRPGRPRLPGRGLCPPTAGLRDGPAAVHPQPFTNASQEETQRGFFDARALAVDFRSIGFRECLTEVIRYLGVLEGPSSRADPVRIRLLSHLNSYAAEMEPSPTPAGPLAFPAWPWSFFHSCPGLSAPSSQLAILGRVPGPILPSTSSLAYPIPAFRTTPLRRATGTILPARRNLLPSRGASSTRRARPLERPAAPLPPTHLSPAHCNEPRTDLLSATAKAGDWEPSRARSCPLVSC
ncbi:hypothetical protein E2I00_002348 [Balaenoptera physalus]|uniref:Orange domain-containing protein n=1 Tax=Balaenoptera physalus TaxID=9770 RepID=A0A6A1QB69_BALPH|nr:hypothetical protein E2I00_002348 [Balaenoptera physalus]